MFFKLATVSKLGEFALSVLISYWFSVYNLAQNFLAPPLEHPIAQLTIQV